MKTRLPQIDDLPALQALWKHEESNIDYALQHDECLIDWTSPSLAMKPQVYLQNAEIVGYSRGRATNVQLFLAKNYDVARMMAKQIAGRSKKVTLHLHPYSASFGAFEGETKHSVWEPAMVCPLVDNAPLPHENRLAGRPIWFSAFDLS